ncbi:uncharacterized protein LOC125031221 [Penaeus chinensis]|uniref:uncharacterized protein LOC125031221 n=1 Tax=Penaeus chinensis TaxID=139456 RepID=UPI001FB84A48|nr:uncharacterized protein LOC125031221 [Penaeus chinensis]XP_047477808.1 uncharacterized protein LOC125031221 [Penaeus chinensis]
MAASPSSCLFVALALCLVGSLRAMMHEIPVRSCDGATAPSSLKMECTQFSRGTCILEKGQTYNLTAEFTPDRNLREVESHAAWKTWVEMPLYGQESQVCNGMYLTCPLRAGQLTSFSYPFHVYEFLMRRRYPVIWRLRDVDSEETTLCFVFMIKIL